MNLPSVALENDEVAGVTSLVCNTPVDPIVIGTAPVDTDVAGAVFVSTGCVG